jgi:hypothetical protein
VPIVSMQPTRKAMTAFVGRRGWTTSASSALATTGSTTRDSSGMPAPAWVLVIDLRSAVETWFASWTARASEAARARISISGSAPPSSERTTSAVYSSGSGNFFDPLTRRSTSSLSERFAYSVARYCIRSGSPYLGRTAPLSVTICSSFARPHGKPASETRIVVVLSWIAMPRSDRPSPLTFTSAATVSRSVNPSPINVMSL